MTICTLFSGILAIASYFLIPVLAVETSTQAAEGPQLVVVIMVEFPDKKLTVSIEAVRRMVFSELNDYYRWSSYGRLWIEGDIARKVYRTATPLSKLDIQKWSFNWDHMDQFRREAIKAADEDVNYRKYRYVIIVAAGGVWPHALCRFEITTNDGVSSLRLFVVNERSELGTYAHELGHILPSSYRPWGGCGLPDLYSYKAAEKDEDPHIFVGPWDIMGWTRPPRGFSAWSKLTLGWIEPKTLSRLTATTLYVEDLDPLDAAAGLRAIKIPLAGGTYYIIEVRRKIGYDASLPGEGVLIYLIDERKESGYGPVRVIDARPLTKSLDDAAFQVGMKFEDEKNRVYVFIAFKKEARFTLGISGSPVLSLKDSDGDGLVDYIEERIGTDPKKADSDGDGLKDGEEVNVHNTDPLKADTDGDGLTDGSEVNTYRTDPLKADTEGDGLSDGDEVNIHKTDPLKPDSDGDGLSDGEEVTKHKTSPLERDTDKDGLDDKEEIEVRKTDPLKADTDDDGLGDKEELAAKTDPLKADTDGDSLKDGDEVRVHGTDPLKPDSDDDALMDGKEIAQGTNPLDDDSDDDGLSDGRELELRTNPLNADSDGDGLKDGDEMKAATDPLDADSDDDGWSDSADFAPTQALLPNGLIVGIVIVAIAGGFAFWRRRARTPPFPQPAAPL